MQGVPAIMPIYKTTKDVIICAMLVFKTINAMYIENVLQPSLQFLVSDVPITMGIQWQQFERILPFTYYILKQT